MRLDQRTAELLDFPAVLEQVAQYASFSLGKQFVVSLSPAADAEGAKFRLRLTSEARLALASGLDLSLGGVHDILPLVRRAESGGSLDAKELLDIRDTLLAVAKIRSALSANGAFDRFQCLVSLTAGLDPLPALVAEIERCVGDDGQILDQASPSLARIRSSLRDAHERLIGRLQAILAAPTYQAALRDRIITQREGRYVVPVKVEAKSQIPGLVHDQSASGATLFVEPLEVVELTNQWKGLQQREQKEIARVLAKLSRFVGQFADQLARDVQILGELDRTLAMARYADAHDATEPTLADPADETPLDLRRARHPLIPRDRVVPIDVWLRGFRMLVITGPNTGGKTVALKTVGLMTAMAMCGLHLPAQAGSRVPAVDAVFADIGDEQGVLQNLSTFSSHVLNVARIVDGCTERSLVLLDEIGAGTDPEEGSAIGRAVLGHLLEKGPLVLATSHHRDVKAFAYMTDGVENASVEFDVASLAPTYRLRIGFAGSSHALTIARRLGLPEEIVTQAEALLSPGASTFEGLLKNLEREMRSLEETRARLEAEEKQARMLRHELEARLRGLDEEVAKARHQALEVLGAEVEQLRERLRRLLKAAEAREASKKWYGAALGEVHALAQDISKLASNRARAVPEEVHLEPGQVVWVEELQSEGELMRLSGGRAVVRVGNVVVSLEAAGLRPLATVGKDAATRPKVARPSLPPEQLIVVGMRTAEAEAKVERYINRAAMAGLKQVRIIHGVGTGTLRNFLRDMLRSHPLVASLRPAGPREGGDGVTIVELNAV